MYAAECAQPTPESDMMQKILRYMPAANVMKLFVLVGIVWAAVLGPASFVLVLTDVGATNSQIGIFAAIASVLSVVFQPVWGMLSDKLRSPRKVLSFCLIGSGIFFGSVLFSDNFYVVVALLLLDAIARCGVIALLDSHTVTEVSKVPGLQYSHVRFAGSIFFGLLSFAYSGIIDNSGVRMIIPISAAVAAFAVFWGLFVCRPAKQNAGAEATHVKPNLKKDAISLLKDKQYILLLVSIGFMALGAQPLWIFMVEFLARVGGSLGDVPRVGALRCVTEIPVFIFIAVVCKNTAPKKLMITGAIFMLLYVVVLFFADSFFWIAAAHMFGGTPGFIFLLTGRLRYVNEATPESVRSTSITLMGTMEVALGSILGSLVGGFVLDIYGTRMLTMLSFVAISASIVILMFLKRRTNTV